MLPLSIAEKLQQLAQGELLPASRLRHALVSEMITEGIINERLSGRTKSTLYIADKPAFENYLDSRFGIPDLTAYIATCRNEDATRADLVQVSSDSKTAARRTFKGFLVNTYAPLACTLNGDPFIIHPTTGTFHFIYDFEQFVLPAGAIVAGVENAESFRHAAKLRYLFGDESILFVSRYPQSQSKDLLRWLLSIPNAYLHMGDYDLAGINIYLQEYKTHLGSRASFFIPPNIEALITKYGNRKLYDQQQLNAAVPIAEPGIHQLIALLHQHKKGLEQEALLLHQ